MIRWYKCRSCGKEFRRIFDGNTDPPTHCYYCNSTEFELLHYNTLMKEYRHIVRRDR